MNAIEEDIELAKLWSTPAAGVETPGDGDGWRPTCYRLALEVERLRARNDLLELELTVAASALACNASENIALRAGLSKVATNLGNGSVVSADASLAFLCDDLPEEVRLYCQRLRQVIAAALPFVTDAKWQQIAIKNYAASERIERIETAMKSAQ